MRISKKLLEVWKQIDPIIVELKPGEKRRVDNWIVEKTEGGIVIIYEASEGE